MSERVPNENNRAMEMMIWVIIAILGLRSTKVLAMQTPIGVSNTPDAAREVSSGDNTNAARPKDARIEDRNHCGFPMQNTFPDPSSAMNGKKRTMYRV